MRIPGLAVAVVALMLVGANANAQSETVVQPRAADKSGQNNSRGPIVKGRAMYEDTGQPATRHRVQLVGIEVLANRRGRNRIPTVMTDANGEFIFHHAGAGEYYIVTHPIDEHVPSAERAPFPVERGDPEADAARLKQYKIDFPKITVNAEGLVEINLRVKNPHFGSIAGRIVSGNGGAVAGTNVHAMKTGGREFGAGAITDKNGAYRIRGLPAGEYVVGANPPRKVSGAAGRESYSGVLGATYFPSTIDSRTSPPVIVSPDREVSDINITLAERSLHNVAGTVRDEVDGHPIAGAMVRLTKKDQDRTGIEAAMSHYSSRSDAQGRWFLNNLPDGVYTIDVRPMARLGGERPEEFVHKRQDLTVAGVDVENLAIEVSRGGRVSGNIITEKGNEPAPDISISIGSAIARVEVNGEFTVMGVPEGEFPFAVMMMPHNVFYVKSIQVNGADLLREKLKSGAGAEIKDVRVVIAPASILTGRVLSASGKTPLRNVTVYLVPADPSTSPAFSRPYGETNEQGVFLVSGAPGEYFLVMWGRGEPLPPRDVASIKELAPNTTRVTLAPGQRKSMDLIK